MKHTKSGGLTLSEVAEKMGYCYMSAVLHIHKLRKQKLVKANRVSVLRRKKNNNNFRPELSNMNKVWVAV